MITIREARRVQGVGDQINKLDPGHSDFRAEYGERRRSIDPGEAQVLGALPTCTGSRSSASTSAGQSNEPLHCPCGSPMPPLVF